MSDQHEERRRQRAEAHRKAYDPRRVPGNPAIGFAAKPVTSPPWNLEVGDFELDLVVRSAGGVGKGVSVRVSGDALDAIEREQKIRAAGLHKPWRRILRRVITF